MSPHHEHEQHIKGRAVHRMRAEQSKRGDAGIEVRLGDVQNLHPNPHERQVQNQQHQVSDELAGDQFPHQRWLDV